MAMPATNSTAARRLAERICETLHGRGHQAYLVGGCVRDLLLGQIGRAHV